MNAIHKLLNAGKAFIHYLLIPAILPLMLLGFAAGRLFSALRAGFQDGTL